MLKKNLVIQEDLKDCGPACLLMIIKHYKGYMDINILKEMCKTDKNGTTAYHLIEAAKKIGFDSYGVRCKIDEIDNNMLPCIAHMVNDSYQHFVVIEKITPKKIVVKDPIGKIINYSYEDFEKIYNQVIIILTPINKIKYLPNNSFKPFIKKIMESSKTQLIQTIIISFFITILSIISSFYFQYMIDTTKEKAVLIFIIFLIINIFKIISDYLRNNLIILINQKIDLELSYNTFKKVISLSYHYYSNHTTGEIISKINDLDSVRQVISKVAINLFIDLPLTLIALIIMYIISPKLFLISLIMILLYLAIIFITKNKIMDSLDDCIDKKSQINSYMVEAINGFESIKGANLEDKIESNYEDKYANFSNTLYDFDIFNNKQYLFKELINGIGLMIIVLIGIILIIDGNLTLGKLISFNSLLMYFLEPIKNIIDLNYSIKQAKLAIKKVLHLYYKEEDEGIIDNEFSGDIRFNNLSYSYDDINNVLDNINLEIKAKSKVMVIGSSGSGKSTLFKLLKKYYKTKRNTIYINNIDINDYKKSDIVYVSQNEILFQDTIINNIGSNDINIAKICLIDEMVKKLPLGYKTLIEENGFNISGGEKQRIILARALNNNFKILVIDEGLSQVDINMERKILKSLFNQYKDKTIIFISHRIDNMDLFNQIIEIKEGKVLNVSKNS